MPLAEFRNLGSVGLVRDAQDSSDLQGAAWTDGSNIRFGPRGVELMQADRHTGPTLAGTPIFLQGFPPVDNTTWVYGTEDRMWAFRADHMHVDISRDGDPYDASYWQGIVFQGVGVFNNGVDVPQQWPEIEPLVRLEDLELWPSNLRTYSLRGFKNYLVAIRLTEDGEEKPFRVRWSHPAAPGTAACSWDITDPAQDAGEVDLAETPGYLVDQLSWGDLHILYKQDSVWAMWLVGPPMIFRFGMLLRGEGLLARDCMVEVPQGHFFVTRNDIRLHNGQRGSSQSLVDRRMRQWFFDELHEEEYEKTFCVRNPALREVWAFFPHKSDGLIHQALVWNWETGVLTRWEEDEPVTLSASSGVLNGGFWDPPE